jgi:hypothetical protein
MAWEGAPRSTPPVVLATACVDALGLCPEQSWAFWRAELSGFVESPFVCRNGQRATLALLPTLPTKLSGDARLARLLELSGAQLRPLLASLPGGLRLSVTLAAPPLAERSSALQRVLETLLGPELARRVQPGAGGNAGFGMALQQAVAQLPAGADLALVGAVSTPHDPTRIEQLLEANLVYDGETVDAPIHGEAAVWVLLGTPEAASLLRQAPLAVLEGAAVVEHGAEPLARGAGIAAVVGALGRRARVAGRRLDWILSDLDAEPGRAEAMLVGMNRALAPGGLDGSGDYVEVAAPGTRTTPLPEQFGSLGPATLGTAAVIAIESFRRGMPESVRALLVAGDASASAALMLARPAPRSREKVT